MKIRKIIFAVDPFNKDKQLRSKTKDLLRTLVEKTNASIRPTYVLSPTQLNISFDIRPDVVEQYIADAETAFAEYINRLKIPNLLPPQIVNQAVASKRLSSRELIEFAIEENADVILVDSHRKSGLDRLVLGSFTESLLLQSPIPVVVLGPCTQELRSPRHILFPSALEKNGKFLLKQAVELAQLFNSKLTIFHAITQPVNLFANQKNRSFLFRSRYASRRAAIARLLIEEKEAKMQSLANWVEWARSQGVQTDSVVDSRIRNITEGIVSFAARRKADLIVMAAQSGPIAAALLGSVTRGVIRQSPCPVWVVRQSAQRAAILEEESEIQKKAA